MGAGRGFIASRGKRGKKQHWRTRNMKGRFLADERPKEESAATLEGE